jgi:hypothetical protein
VGIAISAGVEINGFLRLKDIADADLVLYNGKCRILDFVRNCHMHFWLKTGCNDKCYT